MPTYVAQVSSLYPIDLASALYAGLAEERSQFRIFLSDVAEIPDNPAIRKYVARAALPLCQWSLDVGNIWRQHHIPLDGVSPDALCASLTEVGKSLADCEDCDSAILSRCKELGDAAVSRIPNIRYGWKSYWAPFAACIIQEIFEQVLNIKIQVEPYWPFRLGQQGQDNEYSGASQRALNRLLQHAKEVSPQILAFSKGGYIDLEISKNPSLWRKYSQISVNDSVVQLSIPESAGKTQIQSNQITKLRFRFGGPLELMQLQEFGTIVDLPWYAEANLWFQRPSAYSGVEFISPIVTNSLNRVCSASGGSGYRLLPLGYSLIEFNSTAITALLRNKLKVPLFSLDDLADWRLFIYQFPRSSQRLTKHQHSARAYRNLRETDSRQRISSRDVSSLRILERPVTEISALLFGQYLTELTGLISLLKEWTSPACPNSVPTTILEFLRRLDWLDESDTLVPSTIISTFNDAVNVTRKWLQSHGWSFSTEDWTHVKDASDVLITHGRRSLSGAAKDKDSDLAGFGLLTRVLRELVDHYYSFVGFCAGAVFKAQILFPYILLGPEEYRSEIDRLLTSRGEHNRLYFEPVLWDIQGPSHLDGQLGEILSFEDPDE